MLSIRNRISQEDLFAKNMLDIFERNPSKKVNVVWSCSAFWYYATFAFG